MFTPLFRTKSNHLPILSKDEIDTIGERLVEDFCPQAMVTPSEIDIDRFTTRYLGMTQDFQYLSHCGLYLGMTVFTSTDKVPVFNPTTFQAEYIHANAGTVIIDNSLLDAKQEHRYRFTLGHEAAHNVLHSDYFKHNYSSVSNYAPMMQCRVDNTRISGCKSSNRSDSDWMEWQANRLSSAILLPKSMVIKAAKAAERKSISANAALEAVIDIFNVSNDAAHYRLLDLGLITARQKNY